jgi:tRNA pseudouridine55 synthase
MNHIEKIFAVYKPKGPTSNAVLNQIRRKLGTRKVGHAGTLDPLAEGVLVVGINEGTKKLTEVVAKEKEYIAEIKLGATSNTDDAEGQISYSNVLENIGITDLEKVLDQFVGKIMQTPPIYSALKIKGRPAYKYARAGEDITMKPREVEIESIEVLEYSWPVLKLKAVTGPGVYIRSLARDIGEKLKVGGYLLSLSRTRVGDFKIEDAITVEEIKIEQQSF